MPSGWWVNQQNPHQLTRCCWSFLTHPAGLGVRPGDKAWVRPPGFDSPGAGLGASPMPVPPMMKDGKRMKHMRTDEARSMVASPCARRHAPLPECPCSWRQGIEVHENCTPGLAGTALTLSVAHCIGGATSPRQVCRACLVRADRLDTRPVTTLGEGSG